MNTEQYLLQISQIISKLRCRRLKLGFLQSYFRELDEVKVHRERILDY